jgi:Uma2 family endonuclease
MDASGQPMEETMIVPAVAPDYLAEGDLRELADRLLESKRVEYVDEGVLLIMNPLAAEHRSIVRLMVRDITLASARGVTSQDWDINSENFQWETGDGSRRFFIPDVVVIRPGARTPAEEQAGIVLVAEVTSPGSSDTVYNDRVVKPVQYAKGRVPLYLLVDQERTAWSLHGLARGKPGYELIAAGVYGDDVPLPAPLGFSLPTSEWPKWSEGD